MTKMLKSIMIMLFLGIMIMYPWMIKHYMFTLIDHDKFIFRDYMHVSCMLMNMIFFMNFLMYSVSLLMHHIIMNNFGHQYNYIYPFMDKVELYLYNILLKIFMMLFKYFYTENMDEMLNSEIDSEKKQILLWDFFYFKIIIFMLMYTLMLFILMKIFGITNLSGIMMEHMRKYSFYYSVFTVVMMMFMLTKVKY